VEALLKIGAWGFLLAPNTYMRSGACGAEVIHASVLVPSRACHTLCCF